MAVSVPAAITLNGDAYFVSRTSNISGMSNISSSQGIFSFWFSLAYTGPYNQYVLSGYGENDSTSISAYFSAHYINGENAPYLTFQIHGQSVYQNLLATWTNPIPAADEKWHNIIIAWDVSSGPNVVAYLDGVLLTLPTLNNISGTYANWYLWGTTIQVVDAMIGSLVSQNQNPPQTICSTQYSHSSTFTQSWVAGSTMTVISQANNVTVSGGSVSITGNGTLSVSFGSTLLQTITGNADLVNIGVGIKINGSLEASQVVAFFANGGQVSCSIPTVNAPVTITPVYEFTVNVGSGGGTALMNFENISTAGNGLIVYDTEALPFVFNGSNTNVWVVGYNQYAAPSQTSPGFVGGLSEVYLNLASADYITWLQTPANLEMFIDQHGYAVSLGGILGYLPFNNIPQIYLHGSLPYFNLSIPANVAAQQPTNFSPFTIAGQPGQAATDPFPGLGV